jgi:hypothetical protein
MSGYLIGTARARLCLVIHGPLDPTLKVIILVVPGPPVLYERMAGI